MTVFVPVYACQGINFLPGNAALNTGIERGDWEMENQKYV